MFYSGGAVSTMLAREYDLGDGRVRSHVRRVDGRLSDTIRYYDAHAAAYAATTMAIDTSVQLDRFGSLLPPNAKVLDAGCGSGRDLARLARLGFHPVGLDLSAGLAAIARQTSGCEVMVGDLRELHMSDCSFEGVWGSAGAGRFRAVHKGHHQCGLVASRTLGRAGAGIRHAFDA